MKSLHQHRTRPVRVWHLVIFAICLVGVILVIFTSIWIIWLSEKQSGQSTIVGQSTSKKEVFPAIEADKLSPLRAKTISVLHQQFDNPQPGEFYSQGEKQDWCANFVSWVSRQAGAPLVNPHSGGWRIPGVRSLETAYRNSGKFRAANSGYQPRPGDTIMYDTTSRHGEHVNFVLKYDDGKVTTIGGNEGSSISNSIRVQQFDLRNDGPIRGFGVLE